MEVHPARGSVNVTVDPTTTWLLTQMAAFCVLGDDRQEPLQIDRAGRGRRFMCGLTPAEPVAVRTVWRR
jgi:hypothetical protein